MRKLLWKIGLYLRAITGLHNVRDGSTCVISRVLFDVHDYHKDQGGDGHPSHLHTYTCSVCGKEFTI